MNIVVSLTLMSFSVNLFCNRSKCESARVCLLRMKTPTVVPYLMSQLIVLFFLGVVSTLLFYHLKLRCFVVIELKAVDFDPAFVGQINLYLSAIDDQMRHSDDRPTIGLLLCRSKHQVVVEYALRDLKKPIGVAGWETTLAKVLPERYVDSLPSVEELEAELGHGETY